MSVQTLTPFKAHFEYRQSININKTIDEDLWKRVFEKSNTVTSCHFIYNHHIGFDIQYNKRGTMVNLDLTAIHTTRPENLTVNDYKTYLEFKINSKTIIVLQIIDNKITFSNDVNEVYTVETNDNLVLIRD